MIKKIKFLATVLLIAQLWCMDTMAFEKNTGQLSNLVVFVRFGDEDASSVFTDNKTSFYDNLFNGNAENANSVFNYFRKASYGQLQWQSYFYPAAQGDRIESMRVNYERAYYKEKNSLATTGYENETEAAARLQALVKEIAANLDKNLADGANLDANNDGLVDNLTIVFSGGSDISAKKLLWPKRNDLILPDEKAVYIKGKKLVGYLMVFDEANGYDFNASNTNIALNTGVLCHEMSHSLGTYDLYHANDNLNPVGVWDLMSDNQRAAQNMTVYTKMRYCKWIDEIPEISTPGTYTLNPVGGDTKENIAYKIKPSGSDEYFIVEYRDKKGFDANLPEAGLIVYRINPAYTGGNVNYNGTTRLDEQYIFRPGGSLTTDGNIGQAAFSKENGRTAFGGSSDYKPFYSDGTAARFALKNISSAGATISFDLADMGQTITIKDSLVKLGGKAGSASSITVASDVAWKIDGLPSWLSVTPTGGEAGNTTVTLTALAANDSPKSQTADIVFTGVDNTGIKKTVRVVQLSDIVGIPQNLKATAEGGGIHLSWDALESGTAVLSDDFENLQNPNGWTIENSDSRGWAYKEGKTDKGYYRPYAGTYAMTMVEAWDPAVEDQKLTSPLFAYGKTLEFYSRSTAAGRTPTIPQYYNVEVSNDNGATWTPLYNVSTDGKTPGQYEKVVLDLSDHQSAQMRLRFHAYSSNPDGLSYYWQIDNLSVYSEDGGANVKYYNIYRNGKLIGTSQTADYMDAAPESGSNVYTVSAVTGSGEGSPSDEVSVSFNSIGNITVPVSAATEIYTLDGRKVHNLSKRGIYIVKDRRTVRKVIVK